MRRYPFKNVVNLRDLGGYPISLGVYTEFGRILRSDAPCEISDEEKQFLLDMKVNTIIDLRSRDETLRNPCAFAGMAEFGYYNFNFSAGSTIWRTEDDIPVFYTDLADDKIMAQIMRTIANAPGGVLIHCAAGKDRTGVTAALLLLLTGVSKLDVLADYQISYTHLQDKIKGFMSGNPDMPAFAVKSNARSMAGFLEAFFAKHGTAEKYFSDYLELSVTEIGRLKKKLLPTADDSINA